MGGEWMFWAVVALFLIYRILEILKNKKDEPWFSLPHRDMWSAAGRLSLLALALGMILLSVRSLGDNDFLLAFYPVRYWCVATAALLAIIFRLGSSVERRVAGAAGILVFGSLEVYSAVVRYPHYGPIVKGYAAFCLALAAIAVVRRLRRHHNPVASTG
jgi:peptidoglycan/LPS O-acetylase OafA/YrhL